MYTVIPEDQRRQMTRKEIENAFDGKWVFLTKIIDEPFSAVPVIYADYHMEGSEDGIYAQFISDATKIGEATGEMSLLKWGAGISGFDAY